MEKGPRPNSVSVTDDGNFCAFVDDQHLSVYNTIGEKHMCTVKGIADVTETKALKISPSKKAVGWLQISPEELWIVHVNEQTITRLFGHNNIPYDDILWSPDGKSLAAFSCLSAYIDILTIDKGETTRTAVLTGAIEDELGHPLAQFSPDGKYFATVSTSNQGYSINIFNSENASWDCIQRMVYSSCYDVGGLLWSSVSASLLVWQSGPKLQLRMWTMKEIVVRSLEADEAAVSCVCLSSCGKVAAISTKDCRVRIMDLAMWRIDRSEVLVHRPILHNTSARARLKQSNEASGDVTNFEPVRDISLHKDRSQQQRSLAQFSEDGQYIATYQSAYPSTLWVWRLIGGFLLDTVIALRDDTRISEILWHKEEVLLAANLSSGGVLVWTPDRTRILNPEYFPWPLTAQQYLATFKKLDPPPQETSN